MKPSQTWQFSSRAADIDIARILKEAGKVRDVLRLTVAGKVFTLAPRQLAERRGFVDLALGVLTTSTKFDNTHVDLRVLGLDPVHTAVWSLNRAQEVLVFDQDLACKLVRCVVTKVECF